ncbi:MAG: amino acid--tRNA ligase-related protein [Pyrinomonadaceae bacterium]
MEIPEFNEIIEPNDQTEARREHLEALRELVGNVYPNKFVRSTVSGGEDTISRLIAHEPVTAIAEEMAAVKKSLKEGERPPSDVKDALNERLKELGRVRIAGRLTTPPRGNFVHLTDGIEKLQIYCKKGAFNAVPNDFRGLLDFPDSWSVWGLIDHGDFIGVEGYLFVTNTGEVSVHVEKLQFLAKAMLPMPDKMHGIADAELRRRYRYVDLIGSSLQVKSEPPASAGGQELTTREVFERRAKIISSMRRYLEDHSYIEVETPMLTPKATGAAAEPFETYHKALDIKLYARIAPELYLKRLMVGGFEKVFELNRNFRNEGLSHKHNPEFTMLEFYCAYMDVNGMMDFCEEMLQNSVSRVVGSLKVSSQLDDFPPTEIDFGRFARHTMRESIVEYINPTWNDLGKGDIDLNWLRDLTNLRRLILFIALINERLIEFGKSVLESEKQTYGRIFSNYLPVVTYFRKHALSEENEEEKKVLIVVNRIDNQKEIWDSTERLNNELIVDFAGIDRFDYTTQKVLKATIDPKHSASYQDALIIQLLFEELVEDDLIQPTFIVDYPKIISPLSKADPMDPTIAERFELFIDGMEVANGFSELNDPKEQYDRFVDQMKERESGDAEAMILDEDYIKALSYGMPPAAGIGIGIDRIVMLLTNQHSIRDVILFPHMRPEKKEGEKGSEGEGEKEN